MARLARARKLPVARVRERLEANLGYTLHKPTRRRFKTLPVIVFAIDEQWVADLIEDNRSEEHTSELQSR